MAAVGPQPLRRTCWWLVTKVCEEADSVRAAVQEGTTAVLVKKCEGDLHRNRKQASKQGGEFFPPAISS